jgi:uncharacterized phosphosugar-binding protein
MNWAKKQANAKRVSSSSRVMAVGSAQAVTSAAVAVVISVVGAEILAVEQVVTLVEVGAEILGVGAVAISKAENRGRGMPRPLLFLPSCCVYIKVMTMLGTIAWPHISLR